jgi:hypothetical protein
MNRETMISQFTKRFRNDYQHFNNMVIYIIMISDNLRDLREKQMQNSPADIADLR